MIECVPVHHVIGELKQINAAHAKEVGYRNQVTDWEQYRKLGEAGVYWVVTKRNGEKLIGYVGFLLFPHLHDLGKPHAAIDAVYLRREHRGYASMNLLKEALSIIKGKGVGKIHAHEKNIGLIKILKRLGFQDKQEIVLEMECK